MFSKQQKEPRIMLSLLPKRTRKDGGRTRKSKSMRRIKEEIEEERM